MAISPQLPKKTLIGRAAVAYLAWIVSLLLWLWFLLLGRNSLLAILGTYYVRGGLQRRFEAQFAERAFVFTIGIIWVILMVVVEEYFRRGIKKGDLLRRIGRVFAPIILLIFIADFALAFVVGLGTLSWLRWVLLFIELFFGMAMAWLGKKAPVLDKIRSPMGFEP